MRDKEDTKFETSVHVNWVK